MRCRLGRDRIVYDWVQKQVSLRGTSANGEKVATPRGFVGGARPILDEGEWVTRLDLTCNQVTIGSPERATSLRYGLTNLDLRGNEGYREDYPDGGFYLGRQSHFEIDGFDVVIRPFRNSQELLDEIKATRSIGVTAEATVVAGLDQRPEVDELIHRLSLLLGLGLGRGIAWTYREALDENGRVVEALHADAITKPWNSSELVPTAGMERFVAASYSTFRAAYERWGLRNAILAYTDAKLETDFLESRALKTVVVMEFLRESYLRNVGSEFLIAEGEFNARLGELRTRMLPILQELFQPKQRDGEPSAEKQSAEEQEVLRAAIEAVLRNVRGLNRPSFRRTLSAVCVDIGLQVSSKDRARFVEIRDSLVHRMTFLPGEEPYRQYTFVSMMIGKILLGILGWQEYRDWVNDPNTVLRLPLVSKQEPPRVAPS